MVRVPMLLKTLKNAPEQLHLSPDDVVELQKYGMGHHRTLAEYGLWAGIDFANQSINPKDCPAGNSPESQSC